MNAVDTLTKAASLVGGDRNKEHGAIAVGFNKTAQFWSAYLNTPISAEQVAIMLTLLKISRTTSGKKLEDHYTDMAGYAAIAGELATEPQTITISIKDMPSQNHSYVVKTPSGKKEIDYDWLKNANPGTPR